MSVLNDDGIPLDLSTVLILFLIPNLILVLFTICNAYLLHLSRNRPQLNHLLGKSANFFAKGALDRIIRDILQNLEVQKRQHEEHTPITQTISLNLPEKPQKSKMVPVSSSSGSIHEKKYDANYLLLVPFQLDLLLTVFVYKLLTRDVYFETCHTFLTTYSNRPNQVICWLKNTNTNISNLSMKKSLYQYCLNQTITYINYEHNDVMCTQYVFKLLNIIDTVTNIFAWHQAIVFVVTKSVIFSHWYQQKLRKTSCWPKLFSYERRIIVSAATCCVIFVYIIMFIIILPARFLLGDRRRVDLTRHLLYACSKFLVGMIVHVNLYTFYQWHSLMAQKKRLLMLDKKEKLSWDQPIALNMSADNSIYASPPSSLVVNDHLDVPRRKYLAPTASI